MTQEAKTILKFVRGLLNWENPEIAKFIIEQAFKDEPDMIEHLKYKLDVENDGNLNYLLLDIDSHCFQKFVDYVLTKR